MTDFLATTPDPMISGTWITAFVCAVIAAIASGVALVVGKTQGRKEASEERNISFKPPLPTVTTREEPEFVTMDVFNGHLARIEDSFEEIKTALDCERGIARTANGNIHRRIDALAEKMGERLGNLEGTLKGVAETTKTLLDIALGKHPRKP